MTLELTALDPRNHECHPHKSQLNRAFVSAAKSACNKSTLGVSWVALSSTKNELQQKLYFRQAMFQNSPVCKLGHGWMLGKVAFPLHSVQRIAVRSTKCQATASAKQFLLNSLQCMKDWIRCRLVKTKKNKKLTIKLWCCNR
jgi:hypothetical protein